MIFKIWQSTFRRIIRLLSAILFFLKQSVQQPAALARVPLRFKISGQEFLDGKTIFIIHEWNGTGEKRLFAHELYSNKRLLKQFSFEDVDNIIYTAVYEQALSDIN